MEIKVLKDGEILEYSINDYLFGVLAAEMPALYDEEALKAQAVAAYTFANVELREVPKPLVQALIATEDKNFYKHHGFDIERGTSGKVAGLNAKEYKMGTNEDSSDIKIPIYDVYFALINNNIIDFIVCLFAKVPLLSI